LVRIVAVVPLMIALYLPFGWARWVALAIYVGAILTDYFDGLIARRSNEVTGFGKLMVALEAGEVIAANRWGKAKMNAQSIAVFILLLGEPGAAGWRGALAEVGWWAMLVAVLLTLLSGWSYLRDTPRILSVTSKRDQRL
jgi:phosphatidylglycerophosphate synthase